MRCLQGEYYRNSESLFREEDFAKSGWFDILVLSETVRRVAQVKAPMARGSWQNQAKPNGEEAFCTLNTTLHARSARGSGSVELETVSQSPGGKYHQMGS